jgi:hypothetical protein
MLQYVLIPDHEDLMFLQPVAGLEEVARGGWSEVYINPVPISLHPQKSNFYEVGISTFNTLSTSSLPIVLYSNPFQHRHAALSVFSRLFVGDAVYLPGVSNDFG